MKQTTHPVLTAIALAMFAGAAQAGSYTPPIVEPPVVPPVSAAHDWSGAYVGLSYTVDMNGNLGSNLESLRLGYNFENGNLVYGGELTMGRPVSIPGASFSDIGARIGYKAADNLLLIAKVGYGQTNTSPYYLVQAGGEYALSDSFSLTGAYESWIDPNGIFPPTSGLNVGVNFSF